MKFELSLQVISSTPELDTDSMDTFYIETHASIREKFDSIINSHFMSITPYSKEFFIMHPQKKGELDR